jgi:hypothetical protein
VGEVALVQPEVRHGQRHASRPQLGLKASTLKSAYPCCTNYKLHMWCPNQVLKLSFSPFAPLFDAL